MTLSPNPTEISRTAQWLCNNCGPVELNTAGRCANCGSDNVAAILAPKETKASDGL